MKKLALVLCIVVMSQQSAQAGIIGKLKKIFGGHKTAMVNPYAGYPLAGVAPAAPMVNGGGYQTNGTGATPVFINGGYAGTYTPGIGGVANFTGTPGMLNSNFTPIHVGF